MAKRQICVQTVEGDMLLDLDIALDHEDLDEASTMTIRTMFQERKIVAHGRTYPWVDAYTDLQRQLPKSAKLKGCITCRYGNMCPVGNRPDEVFCMRDVLVSSKSDLFYYTEDQTERKKRSRSCTDLCENYQPQAEDYFTYSDFLDLQ